MLKQYEENFFFLEIKGFTPGSNKETIRVGLQLIQDATETGESQEHDKNKFVGGQNNTGQQPNSC